MHQKTKERKQGKKAQPTGIGFDTHNTWSNITKGQK